MGGTIKIVNHLSKAECKAGKRISWWNFESLTQPIKIRLRHHWTNLYTTWLPFPGSPEYVGGRVLETGRLHHGGT
jgi:hypothetical protein